LALVKDDDVWLDQNLRRWNVTEGMTMFAARQHLPAAPLYEESSAL